MATKTLTNTPLVPSLFDEFMKPWSELFESRNLWGRISKIPAVNITENGKNYLVTLAAPGLKREDFKIDIDGDRLTISAEKEEQKEEKEESYGRHEYNYTSFSRSFTLPDNVKQDSIDARYENGELRITLPKKEESAKPVASKHISVK